MKIEKKSLYISISMGILLAIAILWLVVRGCSADLAGNRKVYQIGRDSTWYPIDLRGKERAMVGFTNDLTHEISIQQNFRALVFEVGPNAIFDGLDIGNYDAVFSSLQPNVISRSRYGFSDSFYLVGPVLVVKESSPVDSLKSMAGKIMGIESGALQIFNIKEPPNIVIIPYQTAAIALEHLQDNVIDGVLIDALRAYVWTEGFYEGRLKVATSPLTDSGLRLVTRNRPEYIKWISQFNEGLKAVKENGVFEKLLIKWNLIDTELDSPPDDEDNVRNVGGITSNSRL